MKTIRNISFLNRVFLAMIAALFFNLVFGYFLKVSLSQQEYTLEVEAIYNSDSSMQLYYDSGSDFNSNHMAHRALKQGSNLINFFFKLKGKEHLKYIRLDFGKDRGLSNVQIKSIKLISKRKTIFHLNGGEIFKQIGYKSDITSIDLSKGIMYINNCSKAFDPYINFNPVNELIYPKWFWVLLLVLPFIILFFTPIYKWLYKLIKDRDYGLFLISLFLCSIPLKTAWVSFTSILMLFYAFYHFYINIKIKLKPALLAITMLFVIPMFFIQDDNFSSIDKTFGFVIFPVIFSISNYSVKITQIKKTFTNIFLIIMSLTIVSWLVLILDKGFYYNIDIYNYFIHIKIYANRTLYWLYYDHPTFLAFFILIGSVFLQDLFKRKEITRNYTIVYYILSLIFIILIGSRFAIIIFFLIPLLYRINTNFLAKLIAPLCIIIGGVATYFMGAFDIMRAQLWKISWTAFKDKIWFGFGTGASEKIIKNPQMVKEAGFENILDLNHPHNQYLTYLLENGIIGTTLIILTLFYLLNKFGLDFNKPMLLIFFIILMLMFIESPLKTATPAYLISFLLSIFAAQGADSCRN
ncbi:O-antigen ligase family protein [Sediminicola arcticus]|jgi:O-antigen ligase|uniref:O-antigen ligase family protein n=1 Tax=Sediminicola arcticus TaxID=1574308 RepID=A0ABV2SQW3_9FLAO